MKNKNKNLFFPNKLPISIPLLSFQHGATEIISSARDKAQCFQVCQHTSNNKTNRPAFLSFYFFILAMTWCCLNQSPGYRCIWEQGVNLSETAVYGGLGGDGKEERKGDASAHWKREPFRNKHQSPAHTELAVGKKCSPLQHYQCGAAPGSCRVIFKSIRWWTSSCKH